MDESEVTFLDTTKQFFQRVNSERQFTGSVTETVLDGNGEVRVKVSESDDNHRNGSFHMLFSVDVSMFDSDREYVLDTVAQEGLSPSVLSDEYGTISSELSTLVNEHCGYNPHEIVSDRPAPSEADFDIVYHDSFVVFD